MAFLRFQSIFPGFDGRGIADKELPLTDTSDGYLLFLLYNVITLYVRNSKNPSVTSVMLAQPNAKSLSDPSVTSVLVIFLHNIWILMLFQSNVPVASLRLLP